MKSPKVGLLLCLAHSGCSGTIGDPGLTDLVCTGAYCDPAGAAGDTGRTWNDPGGDNSSGPCTPTTCQVQGKNCGDLADGCGSMLTCGVCVTPEICGGSGVANVCAVPAQVLPPDRLIDWRAAGVFVDGVKGIPFYPVAVNAKDPPHSASGNGSSDDTSGLRSAIAACPAGSAVLIPEGDYRISGTLSIDAGIVVRGEGPGRTKIIQTASQHAFEIRGSGGSTVTDVTGGHTKGSSTVQVQSASSFSVGDVVWIDELNDPEFVTHQGVGTCTWCGRANGTRALGETKIVEAISGNAITLNRPLHHTFKAELAPQLVQKSSRPVEHAGIEDLTVEFADSASEGHAVFMAYTVYSWVKGVESYNSNKKFVELQAGTFGNEVRECYFHDARRFDSDRGYGINISIGGSNHLIENNIVYHVHAPINLESGGTGNVVAYNFVERTEHHEADWFIQQLCTHGAHHHMNLWEGNTAGNVQFDNYWGSASHQVVFRNHLTRHNPGTPVQYNIVAAIVDADNYHNSFVGNILGMPGCDGEVEPIPYPSLSTPVMWKIGFFCCAETGNPSDSKTKQTMIRHGNFDYISKTVAWDTNISDRTFPASLYLTSKPAYFRNLAWPPFAPESPDFDPSQPNRLPAQVCFDEGPRQGLTFDPAACYR